MKEVKEINVLNILNSIMDKKITYGEHQDADLTNFLDSISFVRAIVALEEEFEVEVPDEFLVFNKMNTVNKIVEALKSIKS